MLQENNTHKSKPRRSNTKPRLISSPIKPITLHDPLRNPPRHKPQGAPKLQAFPEQAPSLTPLPEHQGHGALQQHRGHGEHKEREDEDHVERRLSFEGKKAEQALAIEAVVRSRRGARERLSIREDPPGPVSLVARVRVPLERKSIANRVEAKIRTAIVVEDSWRRR